MNNITETNLTVVQGDDQVYNLAFTVGSEPHNLTGSTLKFVAIKSKENPDTSAIITKNITTFIDASKGKAEIRLSHEETNQPLGTYYYRLKLIDNTGSIKTLLRGTLEIEWAK